MIALIVNKPDAPRGPIPYAFELSGLATREVRNVDQADRVARREGPGSCVVVIEAESLAQQPDSETWRSFLKGRPELPAVVTSWGTAEDAIRDLVAGKRRILLENPFDAAAVVAAVRRVSPAPSAETRRTRRSRHPNTPS